MGVWLIVRDEAFTSSVDWPRRGVTSIGGFLLMSLIVANGLGCTSSLLRSPRGDDTPLAEARAEPRLVRDMTRVWGLRPTVIEGIGLATELENTGSDPPVSRQRELLVDDMRRRNVENTGRILASPTTSLVLVRTTLPPGIRKGERLDVEVRTTSRSETESLRSGWLMQTRLQEMAVLGNRVRQGRLMGRADGKILVDSLMNLEQDERSETRGVILGGAVANIDRELGLVLASEHHSVRASALIGTAVNQRFHTYDRGTKRGVANPKRDNFIELAVHHRYRRNLTRYLRVVQAIPIRETPNELLQRIAELESELLVPTTAVSAAIDLEAIGPEALPTLRSGLESDLPLVRFAAAEALAYMNEEDAVPHLVEATQEAPLRWSALTALSSMSHSSAREGITQLFHAASDETRYGAFQALLNFNERDPALRGEAVGDELRLHRVRSQAESLVHIRRTERPEIVIFGEELQLKSPAMLFAGSRMLVETEGPDRLKVSYFSVGSEDRVQRCQNELSALIRAMVAAGGAYTDVVAAINDAKQKGALLARVKFDALPQPGRRYRLSGEELSAEEPEADIQFDGEVESAPTEQSR